MNDNLWVWADSTYTNDWGVCGVWGNTSNSQSNYGSIFAYSYKGWTSCKIAFFTNGLYNSVYFDWELTTGENGTSSIWVYTCDGVSDWSDVSMNGSTRIITISLTTNMLSAGNPWWNDNVLDGCDYVMFWLRANNAYAGLKAIYFYTKIF